MTPQVILLTAAFGAMLLTAALGFVFVPLLRKVNFLQPINNNGPAWHEKKKGTPTMGGWMLILGSICALIFPYLALNGLGEEMAQGLWGQNQKSLSIVILFALANAAVGVADDFVKVIKRRNKGISVWAKLFLQMILTAVFLIELQKSGMLTTWLELPAIGLVDLGVAFYPLSYLLILLVVNSVNLTDGIDGLAGSVSFLVLLTLMMVAVLLGWYHIGLYAAALAGACTGFLFWNFYPAKIFMGDTGSLFLGGSIVAIAYGMGRPELLLIVCLVYFLEAASVVVQMVWFKLSKGKRLFKMTPLHHHFELCGWSEPKITVWFCGATIVCVLLTILFLYTGAF